MSAEARTAFEAANSIKELSPEDVIFKHDAAKHRAILDTRPWSKDPSYFKAVKISALALLKMVTHARSGGNLEVMGLMQGRVEGTTLIVIDSFALPVEGTETRVNAHDQANQYIIDYIDTSKQVGRLEDAIGWYHSHPGYGCWLSGIDVATQRLNQMGQDPFVAIVVDPTRTMASGKVELGAFRTFPANYKPPQAAASAFQSVPLDKIEDFGVHASSYYPLEVSYFKSSLDRHLLDIMWKKYWASTLSASPHLSNIEFTARQLRDVADKLGQSDAKSGRKSLVGGKQIEESALSRASKDVSKIALDALHSLAADLIKQQLFGPPAAPQ